MHEKLWHIMTTLHRAYGAFTPDIVVALAGSETRLPVKRYFAFLTKEGVLTQADFSHRIEREGAAPPMRRSASAVTDQCEQAMWTALRASGTIGAEELALMASIEGRVISAMAARTYLTQLARFGFVARMAAKSYRLLPRMNSGPRAPVIETAIAFDLNLMRAVNVTAQPLVQHILPDANEAGLKRVGGRAA